MEHYYSYHTRVAYSDLGEGAVLSSTGALRILQEAACDASAAVGCSPMELIRGGKAWVLCAWKLRVLRRPEWGEALEVRTWPRRMENHTSDRDFEAYDQSGKLVFAAASRWLLLDVRAGRVAQVTEELASHYTLWDRRALEDDIPAPPAGHDPAARETFAYTALGRDMDTFHHMNNLHYLELAREALPPEAQGQDFANIEILYKRQIKLGERVRFLYSCPEGRHFVEIQDEEGKRTHALLWFY